MYMGYVIGLEGDIRAQRGSQLDSARQACLRVMEGCSRLRMACLVI